MQNAKRYGVDTRTRYDGVWARHKVGCGIEGGKRCNCKPSYFGRAYDRTTKRKQRTSVYPLVAEAVNARQDLIDRLALGRPAAPTTRESLTVSQAREKFIKAAREGKALNKRGKRYQRKAIATLEGRLRHDVEPALGARPLAGIQRGDIQDLVDDLAPVAAGSSVRGVVSAVRSLYKWAEARDFVPEDYNPAEKVKLPALDENPIERVASPAEFSQLLAVLDTNDAVALALAACAAARAEQIRHLLWEEVDLKVGAVELGVHPDARKSGAARRVVPTVPLLLSLLKRAYLEQGRPDGKQPVVPPRYKADSGMVSTGGVLKRAGRRWRAAGLQPITLQEARHTCATWLDAAGVSPRIASYWMGHTSPDKQPGAAVITLARYTHVLPDDVERARAQLADYVAPQRALASR